MLRMHYHIFNMYFLTNASSVLDTLHMYAWVSVSAHTDTHTHTHTHRHTHTHTHTRINYYLLVMKNVWTLNRSRLERAWEEELKTRGPAEARLGRAIRSAYSRRLICSFITVVITLTFSFISSVSRPLLLSSLSSVQWVDHCFCLLFHQFSE